MHQVSRSESWPFSPTSWPRVWFMARTANCSDLVHPRVGSLEKRGRPSVQLGPVFPPVKQGRPFSSSGPAKGKGFHHCVPSTSLSARPPRADRQ